MTTESAIRPESIPAADILAMLRDSGFSISATAGSLRISPPIPEDILPLVRAAKVQILAILGDEEIQTITAQESLWVAGRLPRNDPDQIRLGRLMDSCRDRGNESDWIGLAIETARVFKRRIQ